MNTIKMIGKALLMICCAPVVLVGMVFAIYYAMAAGVVHLIRGRSSEKEMVLQPEAAMQKAADNPKMMQPVGHAVV